MMDTIEQQATCKICGRPIVQKNWGPHKREYCDNGACRQAAYRKRKREEKRRVTIAVTMNEQARIAELEQELAECRQERDSLRNRQYQEVLYHTDTRVRHFKYFLRQQRKPTDTDFFKRFLADKRLNESASRSLYEARLKLYQYSEEDIALFQVAWQDMLFLDN